MIYKVDLENENIRLDIFLSKKLNKSRNHIAKMIKNNDVQVDNKIITKPSMIIKQNMVVDVEEKKATLLDIKEENIHIDILYEDSDILIVNKPKGMVVHPSNGHTHDTLVNAIMYHCKNNLSTINGIIRPGIVHRIDKDTSGILCICKNDFSHNFVSEQFKNHTNIRKYKAIVIGNLKKDTDIIDKPIGRDKKFRLKNAVVENGKNAITKYKVLERFNGYTYIECELFTGRTHQIRVHMQNIGYPLLGDLLYGHPDKNFKEVKTQVLHAYYLSFIHPTTKKQVTFTNEIPQYFEDILNKLRNKYYE